MITELRGGKFKSGFVGAFIAKLSPASSWVQQGLFNLPIRTVAAAVFGGLAARATGGSFSDGAMAAAFAHLFNAEVTIEKKKELFSRLALTFSREADRLRELSTDQFFDEFSQYGAKQTGISLDDDLVRADLIESFRSEVGFFASMDILKKLGGDAYIGSVTEFVIDHSLSRTNLSGASSIYTNTHNLMSFIDVLSGFSGDPRMNVGYQCSPSMCNYSVRVHK